MDYFPPSPPSVFNLNLYFLLFCGKLDHYRWYRVRSLFHSLVTLIEKKCFIMFRQKLLYFSVCPLPLDSPKRAWLHCHCTLSLDIDAACAVSSPVGFGGWYLHSWGDGVHPVPHWLCSVCSSLTRGGGSSPSPCRRSAGQTLLQRERVKVRVPTAAASMTKGAAIPRTSTRITGARHPASRALKTMRATRIHLLNSKCCRHSPKCFRHRAVLAKLLLPHHLSQPSYQHRCQQHQALLWLHHRSHHQHPSPPASPRPLLHRHHLTLTYSRPLPCTHRGCHRLTLHCSL